VDETAEAVSALDAAGCHGRDRDHVSGSIGSWLVKALVRTRLVVVADELAPGCLISRSGCLNGTRRRGCRPFVAWA
jgi:hypothetical protein